MHNKKKLLKSRMDKVRAGKREETGTHQWAFAWKKKIGDNISEEWSHLNNSSAGWEGSRELCPFVHSGPCSLVNVAQ